MVQSIWAVKNYLLCLGIQGTVVDTGGTAVNKKGRTLACGTNILVLYFHNSHELQFPICTMGAIILEFL